MKDLLIKKEELLSLNSIIYARVLELRHDIIPMCKRNISYYQDCCVDKTDEDYVCNSDLLSFWTDHLEESESSLRIAEMFLEKIRSCYETVK